MLPFREVKNYGPTENWYALYVSIICNLTVDKALEAMEIKIDMNEEKREAYRLYGMKRCNISETETQRICELYETMSGKEIAVIYGVSATTIYKYMGKYHIGRRSRAENGRINKALRLGKTTKKPG